MSVVETNWHSFFVWISCRKIIEDSDCSTLSHMVWVAPFTLKLRVAYRGHPSSVEETVFWFATHFWVLDAISYRRNFSEFVSRMWFHLQKMGVSCMPPYIKYQTIRKKSLWQFAFGIPNIQHSRHSSLWSFRHSGRLTHSAFRPIAVVLSNYRASTNHRLRYVDGAARGNSMSSETTAIAAVCDNYWS